MRLSRRTAVAAGAGAIVVAGVLVAMVAGGSEPSNNRGSVDTSEPTTPGTTATEPPRPYSLAATRGCLRVAGFAMSGITSSDPRLRALGDLAQRTSLEARRGGQTIGLAFGDARLLASLLQVPADPYRLEVHRNALLMYRPGARAEAAALRECLRT